MAVAALLLVSMLAGCGGGGSKDAGGPAGPSAAKLRADVRASTSSTAADFPATRGRSLQALGDTISAGPKVGLATEVLVPGRNRLAFGIIDDRNHFIYGKSAVYVAPAPGAPAEGPYRAPADVLVTDPPFRSQTAASEKDAFAAVYEAQVPFKRTGTYAVLVVTHIGSRTYGAAASVKVIPASRDTVAKVGRPAPRVATDTVGSAGGDLAKIDTRVPHDDMHDSSLKDVLGKKPVVLLFATPQLCQSRVCGPVVDIAEQLKQRYGDRAVFIHQEVYVDNDLQKGLRPPLKAFGLHSEPWLFTIDRHGRVAARIEGSFGFIAFQRAIEAALRPA